MDFRDKQIAPPKGWEKFEDLTLSLFQAIWADPLAQKNGRKGQPQHGVDVFGTPARETGGFHGVQCKGKDQAYGRPATVKEIKVELAKAEKFTPKLKSWVFATTSPVDGRLQQSARELSAARVAQGQFPIAVLGWEDIRHLLAEYPNVLRQYYFEHAIDLDALIAVIQKAPTRHDFETLRRDLLSFVGKPGTNASRGESENWVAVTFDETRDLGPALMGRALGTADVLACPILPEVETIVAELQRAFAARLIGESGSGKSVCALQAARVFSDRGFHVVRLQHAGVQSITLKPSTRATLYLIDDAHLAPPAALRAAEETAGPEKLLLSIHTAHQHSDSSRGAIRLDAKRAVAKIAAALRKDMPGTLRVVRRLDDHIGERPHDEWLETRLDHAEKLADRPWQFCFVLGGGWRRAKQSADSARAAGADIALAAAAIRQIASRDEPAWAQDILDLAEKPDLHAFLSEKAFQWLVEERLLLASDDLRCPHQRFGSVVLAHILSGQSNEGRAAIGALFSSVFSSNAFPLAGLRSLLHELRFMGQYGQWTHLLEPACVKALVERCWKAEIPERVFSLLIFSEINDLFPGWPRALLSGHIAELASWIAAPHDSLGSGVRRLTNALDRLDKSLAQEIVSAADPSLVATAVSSVTPETAYSLGELVAGVGQGGSAEWLDTLRKSFDRERILSLAANWPSDQPTFSFAHFCQSLTWCDDALALDAAERFVPAAAAALANDPLEAIVDLDDIVISVLRMFDPLGVYVGKLAPTPRQRAIARQLCASIDTTMTARRIAAVRKRDFQRASHFLSFLKAASPRKYASIVRGMDWAAIEATIGSDWEHLFHDAEVFLGVCYSAASAPILQQVIERNLKRINVLPPRLAFMAPAAGYLHLESGRQIGLASHSHYHWEWTAGLLGRFSQERPDLIDRLLSPFEAQAGSVLSQRDRSWYRDAALCIRAMRDIAPASLQRVLSSVDCGPAEIGWVASLSAKGGSRRTTALLVEAALPRGDAVGDLARRLRVRFPRTSKPTARDLKSVR
jgi:hypothetical protein